MSVALVRSAVARPGYDCIEKPCGVNGCGERPGACHGRHCVEWLYAVHSRRACLSLVVFSGVYATPEITAKMREGVRWPILADLTLCATYEVAAGDYSYNDGRARDCHYLGRCFTHASWGMRAEQVWREIGGRDRFDQNESFWRALEGFFFRIANERSIELEAP